MFCYREYKENNYLYIELLNKIEFKYDFLDSISHLLYKSLIEKINDKKTIRIYCGEEFECDKMSMAYLYNVFRYISRYKHLEVQNLLLKNITNTVSEEDGAKFKEIDFNTINENKGYIYYVFQGDRDIQKPVDEIVRVLTEKNLTIEKEAVKEFLSTTIGEIFSNAINHSEEKEIFFMYDIPFEDGEFYLCVNVIDYGATIVNNVTKYLCYEGNYEKEFDGKECIKWAIQSGNTTRFGSGGYGLPTLISYVRSMDGILYIFSDRANYSLEAGRVKIKDSKGFFPGTNIIFKVRLFDPKRRLIRYDERSENIKSISLEEI